MKKVKILIKNVEPQYNPFLVIPLQVRKTLEQLSWIQVVAVYEYPLLTKKTLEPDLLQYCTKDDDVFFDVEKSIVIKKIEQLKTYPVDLGRQIAKWIRENLPNFIVFKMKEVEWKVG